MSKCPNCGYCPHCGRKDAPKLNPHPWTTQPWVNPHPVWVNSHPIWWNSPIVTCGSGTYNFTPPPTS